MSSRYVWSKHTPRANWGSPKYAQNHTVPAPGSGNSSGKTGGYVGSDVLGEDGKSILETASCGCRIVSPQSVVISTQKLCDANTQYFAVSQSGSSTFFFLQNSSLLGKAYWMIQPSGAGEIAVNMFPQKADGTIDTSQMLNVGYKEFAGWSVNAGSRTGYASSANQDQYPTVNSAASLKDGVVYAYEGSDSIDPTAVSYSSTELKPGDSVTVSLTPRSNTYGGTVYYQFEYSTDGGASWTGAGARTTAASKAVAIPSGAKKFQARVLASDDMGFTSKTYVTGSSITLADPNTAPSAPDTVTVPDTVVPGQEFTVSWGASSDAEGNLSGYRVERSYDGGSSWTGVGDAVSETSVTDAVAAGHTSVRYRVRAFDAGGLYSPWTVSRSAEINQPPAAPEALSVGTVTYGDYTALTWTAASDPDGSIAGYTLQRAVNGGEYAPVYTGPAVSYTDRAENWGWTDVQYRVRAEDNRGALSGWTLSARRQVQPGRLTLEGGPEDLGSVVKAFAFSVTVSASGQFPVSGIQVVISLDGEERLRTTVSGGGTAGLTFELWGLSSGAHEIAVTASRDKFTSASGVYRFTVVPIEPGERGRLERLENTAGQAVYPVSIVEGIFRKKDGKPLAELLEEAGSGGGAGGQGPAGEDGATFTPSVSTNGTLRWTNNKGLPNPAPVNIKGPPGPAGADGSMSFEDLTPEQKETLKGDPGPVGPQGPAGPAGPAGPPGKDSNPISVVEAVLTGSGWSTETKRQTISVSGVQADELSQLIQPVPKSVSREAYYAAGVLCAAQAENSLTFQCEEIPGGDLTVYILMQGLSESTELPQGYTKIDFIIPNSSNGMWLSKIPNGSRIVMDVALNDIGNYYSVFNRSSPDVYSLACDGEAADLRIDTTSINHTYFAAVYGKRIHIDVNPHAGVAIFDEQEQNCTQASFSENKSGLLNVGGFLDAPDSEEAADWKKIYYIKVIDPTTSSTLHEYIPCNNAEGTPGLYDVTAGKFYETNSMGDES